MGIYKLSGIRIPKLWGYEEWKLSCMDGAVCMTEDGTPLDKLVSDMPLLFKIIKADDVLSVQVHPDNTYAAENEGCNGKTEMWYILDADEGSGIYVGFKRPLSRDELEAAIKNNTIKDELLFHEVKRGDAIFIPAGMCHAIGSGLTIAEIQQSSDITYRLYDWDRVSADGSHRELHIEKSLDVINTSIPSKVISSEGSSYKALAECEYFDVIKIKINKKASFSIDSAFCAFYILSGHGSCEGTLLEKGDTVYSDSNELTLCGELEILMFSEHGKITKKPLKAAIFDLDGTLLDTVEDLAYSVNAALEENGFPTHPTDKYFYFVGNGAKNLIKRALPEGASEDDFTKVYARFGEIYKEHWNVATKPYSGIPEMISELKKDGVLLAILSNKPHERTVEIAQCFFPGVFDVVYGGRPNIPLKPDPYALLEVVRELGVTVEDSFYMGDSGSDMETGRNAGIYSAGAVWGFRTADELMSHGASILVNTASEALEAARNYFKE